MANLLDSAPGGPGDQGHCAAFMNPLPLSTQEFEEGTDKFSEQLRKNSGLGYQ